MQATSTPPVNTLTEKELLLIKLICRQFSIPQIAGILRIENAAVEQLRQQLLQKLNKRSDIGIAIYALENKIIEL